MSLGRPVTCDGWSYSGDFHVEASGNNRHRRATMPELKAVFDGTDGPKDRPAHWYEAQLIHYGLPPSKTKGTAKMRLFEAVNKGNLAVPSHIVKVEADLKKEWVKQERAAKKALKMVATPAARGSNKRKADEGQAGIIPGANVNVNLSISIGPGGNVQLAPTEPAAKKAKTTSTAEKPAPTDSSPGLSSQTTPRTKQTARRSRPFARAGQGRPAPDVPGDEPVPLPRQTARRSRPFTRAGQGRPTAATRQPPRLDATPSQWDSPDDPPPPYPGPPMHINDSHANDSYGKDSYDDEPDQGDGPLPPLGLLNGRYHLRCTAPREHADRGEDSGIVFTLDGDALWGSFEIGPLSGILRLDQRPWSASYQPLYFRWRGEDSQGGDHAESNDGSYVKFMGDGVIVGKIGFYGSMLEFNGYRVSGQATRSEISAFSMRQQWEGRRP
ncbi:hypothetical protein C8A00DRAFT_36693 [Chaetomidium leptoderma]|uniref:Uncharacterized protein n=1 Tax=Chaetomidium leptoderma TaxID=669021 RepID=A0AAN6ZUG6_9PEZI|nr:hypothetical protein C8A00DRAFT_36693 [Chaetomidium leptoderma]